MNLKELKSKYGAEVIDLTILHDLLCYDEVMDRKYLEERIIEYIKWENNTQKTRDLIDNIIVTH